MVGGFRLLSRIGVHLVNDHMGTRDVLLANVLRRQMLRTTNCVHWNMYTFPEESIPLTEQSIDEIMHDLRNRFPLVFRLARERQQRREEAGF